MKKLLSVILVLAMLLGMASVSAFAVNEKYVIAGKSITIKAADGGTGYAWAVSNSSDLVTLTNPNSQTVTVKGNSDKLTGDSGSVTLTCTITGGTSETYTVYVIADKYDLVDHDSDLDRSISVKDTTGTEIKPDLKYGTTAAAGEFLNAATISTDVSTADSQIVTVSSISGGYKVTGKAAGTATVTVKATVGDYVVETLDYDITVSGIDLTDEIDNGDENKLDDYDTAATIKQHFADAINSDFGLRSTAKLDDDDIDHIYVALKSGAYGGDLYKGSTKITATTLAETTAQDIAAADVVFETEEGEIGDVIFDVEVVVDSDKYYGTWTISVLPEDDIEDTQVARFAREAFIPDVPSEVKYMKIVDSEAKAGAYKNLDEDDNVAITVDSSKSTKTVYVVGIDKKGIVHSGTIKFTGANADFSYAGEEDKATTVVKKDFVNLFDDIAEEHDKDDYTLDSVEFELSKKNLYDIFYNGKKMTTSTDDVDVDDLGDVTIEPLTSKEVPVDFTLKGSYKTNKVTYKGRLVINAVTGDIAYTVITSSSTYLKVSDFQDFFEDAMDSTSAVLSYITIDDSGLTSSQGAFYASKTADVEDEKLWADDDDTDKTNPYTIDEVRFVASKNATNGTKIYVPFTAYGTKTAKGSEKQADGYIEFTVINNPFLDVASSDYFYEPALWAVGQGITKGTNAAGTLFSPAQGCTRAQVVTFLYRAAGSPTVSTADVNAITTTFKDVTTAKHSDYLKAIAWAKANKITSGTSATTFAPDKTCTRAQIVTLIANYAQYVDKKSVTPIYANQFTDVKATTTHKAYASAIQWAVEKGITKGTNAAGTLFSPDATCTRGQVVTFLYNYFK